MSAAFEGKVQGRWIPIDLAAVEWVLQALLKSWIGLVDTVSLSEGLGIAPSQATGSGVASTSRPAQKRPSVAP